jgi:hypothetical protein
MDIALYPPMQPSRPCHSTISRSCASVLRQRQPSSSPAKICDHVGSGAEPTRLDRLEPTRKCIVQARQLLVCHVVIGIGEEEINITVGESRWGLARDATVLDANADRLHSLKPSLSC